MKVGIIGSGAWGKALATLAARAGNQPRIGYRSTPPGGFPGQCAGSIRGLGVKRCHKVDPPGRFAARIQGFGAR